MDLQTIGIIISNLRRRCKELEAENRELRQLVEDIVCSPGPHEYDEWLKKQDKDASGK